MNAAVTPGFSIEVPKKAQQGQFFVFFAADQIDGQVKANNPQWQPGGLLRAKMKTLGHRGGFIRKCEITELRPQMLSESISNVHPGERKHLIPTYTIVEGDTATVIGKTKDGGHDGLLRTQFFPADEADTWTGKGDGLVKMPVANADEAIAAQYFLFPEWDEVMSGRVILSRRVADLAEHFQQRLRDAQNDFERNVAQAAIKSCEDYTNWGRRITTAANAMYQQMKTKGWAWAMGTDAEAAFDQLGLARQDNLVQTQGDQMAAMAKAITMMAESQTGARVDPEYAEYLAWKASRDTPVVDDSPAFAVDQLVNVGGRAAKVVRPAISIFGKPAVRVEFLDDQTQKGVLAEAVAVIEEEK